MAKLPTAADLGPAQIASSRPTGSYDVSGFARGAEAIAAGGRALGQGISQAAGDVADVYRKQTEMQVLDAHAGASSELLDLHSKLQESKDYQNLPTQYQEKSKEIVDRWAQTIPDGRMREHYLATSGESLARGQASVDHMSFTGMASTDADARKATVLDIESKIGQDPSNAFLPEALKGFGLRVDKAVDANWITKEQGVLEKRDAAVKVAVRTNEFEYNQDPNGWLQKHGYEARTTKASVWNAVDAAAQKNGIDPEAARKTVKIESNFDPNARTGSYFGLTQLSQSEFAKYNRIPGASIFDPEANLNAGFAKMKAEGDQFASRTGKQPDNFDRYMIHQQGMGGYENHLANPDRPAWENMYATAEGRQKGAGWAQRAIWGNMTKEMKAQFPGGVTTVPSSAFLDLWRAQYGGSAPTFAQQTVGINPGQAPGQAGEDHSGFANIDPITRMRMVTQARSLSQQRSNDAMQASNAQSVQTQQSVERMLIDASAGRGAMPPRELIESLPDLNEGNRNTLLKQWDGANKQDEALQSALARFVDPHAGPFNPVEDNDKKQVDKIYQMLGGGDPDKELPALQAVVDRTGIVPPSAAGALRGALVSNSADRVAQAAQMSRNLLAKNPQIFTGVTGGNALEAAASSFAQYTEHFGMTADEAARKIIEDNSPEYKAKVAARIKGEDVGEIVRKQLSPADMQKAFNENWTMFGRPAVEFTEGAKTAAFSDYQEIFRDRYLETGNVDTAKAQAIGQLKKIWGVSHLNGTSSGTLMRFPPERAPAYADIPDVADRIAAQAIEAIYHEPLGPWEDEKGRRSITRDKIILTPTPGGQTAQAYMAGQPVPYMLSWRDQNDVMHTINPGLNRGRGFVFDGHAERGKIAEERRTKLEGAIEGGAAFAQGLEQAGAGALEGGGQPSPASERQPAAPTAPTPQDTYTLPGNRRSGLPTLK